MLWSKSLKYRICKVCNISWLVVCHCGNSILSTSPTFCSRRETDGVESQCSQLVSTYFQPKPPHCTEMFCFPLYTLYSCMYASLLLCEKTPQNISHSARFRQLCPACCGAIWILSSSTDLLLRIFSPCVSFSPSLYPLSAYWFLFPLSLFLVCASGCWIKPELSYSLPPPGPVGESQCSHCLKEEGHW